MSHNQEVTRHYGLSEFFYHNTSISVAIRGFKIIINYTWVTRISANKLYNMIIYFNTF